MSTINYTYNVIVDRFRQFAAGHFQLRRFTHGEISQADLEKEAEWPWLHVKPRAINYAPGTRTFSFEIFISDLPRDKEDKTGYQAESITDCSLIFQDLINEIYLGNMFGDQVVLTRPVNSEPFVEQYTHTLTGVTGTIELNLDYDWSACSIPASWNYNTPTDSGSDGWGALQFIDSLEQNGVYVSLLNDEETPGNSYYYGTDAEGVKGWHAIVDNIGLTCETLPECATIISILEDIEALQTDKVDKVAGKGLSTEDYTTAEKSKLAGIQAGAEVNVNADWNAVSGDAQILNKPSIPAAQVNSDWNATSGVAEILNKPTIPSIAGLVPETRTLTINGTTQDLSANRTFTIATGLTVGTTPITSGTVGRVLFEGAGNVLQESANFFWDNTNSRLGIKRTPAVELDVSGDIRSSGYVFSQIAQTNTIQTNGSNLSVKGTGGTNYITMFQATGNVLIQNGGTTTDAGFRLDVNGTARVSGNVKFGSNFTWDNTNSRLGINTASPNQNLEVVGTAYISGNVSIGAAYPLATVSFAVTSQITNGVIAYGIRQTGYVQAATTLQAIGIANQLNKSGVNTLGTYTNFFAIGGGSVSGSVTNQMGFSVASNLTNATNNYAFHSELASATGVWNLYMSGTASNYLAGNLLIGTSTDAGYKLDVNGGAIIRQGLQVNNPLSCDTIQPRQNQNLTLSAPWADSTQVAIETITNKAQVLIVRPGANLTLTSSTHDTQRITHTFAPTSGTAVVNALTLQQTINQTGGANGITRGLYINPTITAAADFRAIETTRGRIVFGNLPTSSAGLPTGAIWNDAGTLKIV